MNELVAYQTEPLTAVQVKAQVQRIQEVMAAVMQKDVHYGIIPGTQKPTLFKAGAEKILSTFRIAAHPKEIEDMSTSDEIRYRVKVHGVAMENDQILFGVGIGECSSNEEKYKWRRPVCDEEFNETPEDRRREAWKKYDGKPYKQKQIRTNPSDVANTILKMAKKRAQIDMTLTATGASDVFDQDLEDLPEGIRQEVADKKPPIKAPQKKADAKKAATEAEQIATVKVVSVGSKKGVKKDGSEYTIYTIFDDADVKYGTFDTKIADLAEAAKGTGEKVKISYVVGTYGNKITNLVIEEQEAA
jgi:hypothetical protein